MNKYPCGVPFAIERGNLIGLPQISRHSIITMSLYEGSYFPPLIPGYPGQVKVVKYRNNGLIDILYGSKDKGEIDNPVIGRAYLATVFPEILSANGRLLTIGYRY
jgi:hypothetical protein